MVNILLLPQPLGAKCGRNTAFRRGLWQFEHFRQKREAVLRQDNATKQQDRAVPRFGPSQNRPMHEKGAKPGVSRLQLWSVFAKAYSSSGDHAGSEAKFGVWI